MTNADNRRKHKRVAKAYQVHFRHLKPVESDAWDIVLVKNISAGGILFDHDDPTPVTGILMIKLLLPLAKTPVECKARVLRCQEMGISEKYYRSAAEFVDLTESDKTAIDELLSQFPELK